MASAAPLQPLFPALVLPAREGQLEAALWVLKSSAAFRSRGKDDTLVTSSDTDLYSALSPTNGVAGSTRKCKS